MFKLIAKKLSRNGLVSIEQFFTENPDEELTLADMRVKFDISAVNAKEAVRRAKARIGLESMHVVRLRAKGCGK